MFCENCTREALLNHFLKIHAFLAFYTIRRRDISVACGSFIQALLPVNQRLACRESKWAAYGRLSHRRHSCARRPDLASKV